MTTKAIEQFQNGVLEKDELFIVLARNVCNVETDYDYADLDENHQLELLEWVNSNLLGESTVVVGGVGQLFSEDEVECLQRWHSQTAESDG